MLQTCNSYKDSAAVPERRKATLCRKAGLLHTGTAAFFWSNMLDLTGQTFGRLTVISFARNVGGRNHWLCKCSCGESCVKTSSALGDRSNKQKSCGCARRDSIAKASATAWKVTTKFSHPAKQNLKWMIGNMMMRCYKPDAHRYERYGGRGIRVCDEWRNNHTAFFEWAVANGYRRGLSIERIDHNGNYEPSNCRFIPMAEQASNTAKNCFLTWNGLTLCLSHWAKKLGVRPGAIQHRVARGWKVERIFTQPFRA